uniref:Clc-like protein n=1 Tax=Angiostrongylus cantonensis TaxID=6313 RepID=A0A0K0DGN8_ANGCA
MSTIAQKGLLALSIVFILAGLGLTIAGAFSPAWQVVDIREFRAEHQHGLWWDCIRAEKHVVAVGDFYDETPLHCMYKFDNSAELVIENTLNNIDEDGAAGESEHHRFMAWHKAILFFIITSQLLAFISICTGICATCFPPTAFVFTISLFLALICSLIADGVFFLAANRVDNRFVQGMVGTYEVCLNFLKEGLQTNSEEARAIPSVLPIFLSCTPVTLKNRFASERTLTKHCDLGSF